MYWTLVVIFGVKMVCIFFGVGEMAEVDEEGEEEWCVAWVNAGGDVDVWCVEI